MKVLLIDYRSFTDRLREFYWEITRVLLRDCGSFTERLREFHWGIKKCKTCDQKACLSWWVFKIHKVLLKQSLQMRNYKVLLVYWKFNEFYGQFYWQELHVNTEWVIIHPLHVYSVLNNSYTCVSGSSKIQI